MLPSYPSSDRALRIALFRSTFCNAVCLGVIHMTCTFVFIRIPHTDFVVAQNIYPFMEARSTSNLPTSSTLLLKLFFITLLPLHMSYSHLANLMSVQIRGIKRAAFASIRVTNIPSRAKLKVEVQFHIIPCEYDC